VQGGSQGNLMKRELKGAEVGLQAFLDRDQNLMKRELKDGLPSYLHVDYDGIS